MASKAVDMRKKKVEKFVVEAIGKVTGIDPDDLQLLYRFEGDLRMGYSERLNLSETVHTDYGVRIDLTQYPESKTVGDFVDEIMDNLK